MDAELRRLQREWLSDPGNREVFDRLCARWTRSGDPLPSWLSISAAQELVYRHSAILRGPVVSWDGVALAPADLTSRSARRQPYPQVELADDDERVPEPRAAWIRGRAEKVFQCRVVFADERPERTSFFGEFLAGLTREDGSFVEVAFECEDEGLFFFGHEEAVEERVAGAFWGLLLEEAGEVNDFRDVRYDHRDGTPIVFGVEDGVPFSHEDDGGEEEGWRPNPLSEIPAGTRVYAAPFTQWGLVQWLGFTCNFGVVDEGDEDDQPLDGTLE